MTSVGVQVPTEVPIIHPSPASPMEKSADDQQSSTEDLPRKGRKKPQQKQQLDKKPLESLAHGNWKVEGTSEWQYPADLVITEFSEFANLDIFIYKKLRDYIKDIKKETIFDKVFKRSLNVFHKEMQATISVEKQKGEIHLPYRNLLTKFAVTLEAEVKLERTNASFPVTMGVNAFRGYLDEFIKHHKKEKKKPDKKVKNKNKKPEKEKKDLYEYLGHKYSLTKFGIPTFCEFCSNIIWIMEKGSVCQVCRYTCHKRCVNKSTSHCKGAQVNQELENGSNKEDRSQFSYPEDPTEDLLQHMKTEMTTVRHARGIVVGCGGAGKTTLLYSLMGKRLDEIKKIKSTRGLRVYEHIFVVKEESLIATDNFQQMPLIRIPKSLLTKKNGKNEEADKRMTDDIEDITEIEGTDDIPEVEGSDIPEEIPDKEIEAVVEKKDIVSCPSASDDKPKEEKATTTAIVFQQKASKSHAEYTIARTLSPKVIKKILDAQENEISVSMIDFAGQFAYYACHQIYMRSSAFYILVMDMTKSLEEVVICEEEEQKGCVFTTWKYKDYVEFWLNSIKSFGGPEAQVFIVATHIEEKTKDELKAYFACLWRSLPKVDKTWLSTHLIEEKSEEKEFAFELININEEERTQKLQSLKNSLVDVVSNKLDTKIPVRSSWAFLEHLLRDSGKPIISYEEIQEMNRQVPEQYRLESGEEILKFLTFFHDHGILLYFKGEATRTHAILSLQWFSDAFSRLIADEKHINSDCNRQFIEEWEKFNKTGELNTTLVDALWKDETNAQLYIKYKTELMGYMERLQMLVSIGETGEGQSWYVPCMNKKPFTKDIKTDFNCSSILCFRFKSFALFVFYRLVAYCMSFLKWKVVPDKTNSCLFQTAAVFEYKNHLVVLGICDKDIQLQVVINFLDIKTEISSEVGHLIHKALNELTKTFENTNLSFQRGYKCQKIFCDQNDESFTPVEELCQLEVEKIPCSGCPMGEKHLINVEETHRFWEQQKMGEDKEGNFHCLDDRLNRPPTNKQLKIVSGHIGADFQLLGIQLGLENATIQQIRIDYQNHGVRTQIFQMLCAWKEKEGKQATVEKFLDAIEAHGGEIDFEKIKSAFNL